MRGRGAVVVAAAALLAACGADEPAGPPPPDVATYVFEGSGMDALLTGELVREAGCTYVDADGVRRVPAFPDLGISWSDDVLVVGDEEYPLGAVELGGGNADRSIAVVPAACDPEADVWQVSPRLTDRLGS